MRQEVKKFFNEIYKEIGTDRIADDLIEIMEDDNNREAIFDMCIELINSSKRRSYENLVLVCKPYFKDFIEQVRGFIQNNQDYQISTILLLQFLMKITVYAEEYVTLSLDEARILNQNYYDLFDDSKGNRILDEIVKLIEKK